MASVCPQRILNESIRLVELLVDTESLTEVQYEEAMNNITELQDLIKILPNKVGQQEVTGVV